VWLRPPRRLGVLATLSTAVLGALHHFVPLLTHRHLRSPRLGLATFGSWLAASWLLPLGVATEHESVVEMGGALAILAVTLSTISLFKPLGATGGGVPLISVRLALLGFAATVAFGALYVADRQGGWFDLSGQVVLGHAVVGLFAWLGLTYIAVGEKLWPMFLLARRPPIAALRGSRSLLCRVVSPCCPPGTAPASASTPVSRFAVPLHPAAEPTGRPYLIRGSSLSATRVTRL
jgi:hypothetical protein